MAEMGIQVQRLGLSFFLFMFGWHLFQTSKPWITARDRMSSTTVPAYVPGLDWFHSDEKYFVYSPSGGLNNQRMEFEYSLHISKMLGRTLLIPMLAPHTSLWRNYQKVKFSDLCPVHLIFDVKCLESYGPKVIPLNMSISSFESLMSRMPVNTTRTVFPRKRQSKWHELEVDERLGVWKEAILFLKGPTSK